MVDEHGFALGSLCVIDHQPKQLTQAQLSTLTILAKQVVNLITLRKRNRELKENDERQHAEIAQQIQMRSALTNSEARYRQLSEKLEERVQQRTQELEHANHNLQRSNANLEQFAYIASHDLQEPLRKIQSFGDLLMNQYGAELGEGVDYLQRMQSAASRLSVLIKDMLTYSRISTRREVVRPVALDQVIAGAVDNLSISIEETGAELRVGPLPTVQGDASQLGQLFQNLLSNALKFLPPGKPPYIQVTSQQLRAAELPGSVKPARNTANYYCIDVVDNGIGFDEEQVDRIFQVFQRLHGKNEFSGTGIGLSICEKVAANHGGAITATSQPNQGATFSVYLPA